MEKRKPTIQELKKLMGLGQFRTVHPPHPNKEGREALVQGRWIQIPVEMADPRTSEHSKPEDIMRGRP